MVVLFSAPQMKLALLITEPPLVCFRPPSSQEMVLVNSRFGLGRTVNTASYSVSVSTPYVDSALRYIRAAGGKIAFYMGDEGREATYIPWGIRRAKNQLF